MDFGKRVRIDFSLFAAIFWFVGALVCYSPVYSTELQSVQIEKVSCTWNGINLTVTSRRVFKGAVFPKLNFHNPTCRYVVPDPGTKNLSLFLPLTDCGNLIRKVNSDVYVSNDMIIQAHRLVETDLDVVTGIICKLPRHDSAELHEHNHESHPTHYRNSEVEAWMEFRMGEDLLGTDESNKLLVGEEITIVINVKHDGKYGDFQIEDCWAYEGEDVPKSQYVVKLFDTHRCGVYEWTSNFNITNGYGNASHSAIYGTMKAFKFPLSKNLHLTCSVQVCKKTCFRYCDDLERRTSSNYVKRPRREVLNDVLDQSVRERHRLMKATIKALGAKLIEKNRRAISENDTSFRRRYTNIVDLATQSAENQDKSLGTITNEVLYFNLTNNVVVFSNHEFNFRHEYASISQAPAPNNCVPKLRFGIVTASLSFALFCLIVACIGLIFHIRKENKKHRIDNFLLYSLR